MRLVGTVLGITGLLQLLLTAEASASPVDAQPALQEALDAAAPGAEVHVGPGVHLLGSPLRVPSGVTLRGSGMDVTTLRLDRRAWDQFRYGFIIAPVSTDDQVSTDVTITDLTVDGHRSNRTPQDGTPDGGANEGGGLKTGDRWLVERARFTNLNYFKVWVYHSEAVVVRHCVFDADGGSSGHHDNVGGGRSSNVLVEHNRFAASTRGNAVDVVRSDDIRVIGNDVEGDEESSHGIYLEGVTRGSVEDNAISHAGITIKSESGYPQFGPLRNPRDVVVRGNHVRHAPVPGIAITYDSNDFGQIPGGGNLVTDNVVEEPGTTGIAVIGCASELSDTPDTISGNLVVNPFQRGTPSWGTGCGTVEASGIGLTVGTATELVANTVKDNRDPSLTSWAISFAPNDRVVDPVVTGTTGDTMTKGLVQPH